MSDNYKPGRRSTVNPDSIRDWFIAADFEDAKRTWDRISDVLDIRLKLAAPGLMVNARPRRTRKPAAGDGAIHLSGGES